MENFVFPDEIETKLMKMSKLKNIFYIHRVSEQFKKAIKKPLFSSHTTAM